MRRVRLGKTDLNLTSSMDVDRLDAHAAPAPGRHVRTVARTVGPSSLVVFGVTGELSRAGLLQAVYDLANRGLLPTESSLVGVDAQAKTTAHAPTVDESASDASPNWTVAALLLEATGREALGDAVAAEHGMARALEAPGPDHRLIRFLIHHRPDLPEQHARRKIAPAVTASEILNEPGRLAQPATPKPRSAPMFEQFTDSESRVLRFVPTHLTAAEIGRQLHLSVHTVTTHMRHVYTKLGSHRRHEAVERARARPTRLVPARRITPASHESWIARSLSSRSDGAQHRSRLPGAAPVDHEAEARPFRRVGRGRDLRTAGKIAGTMRYAASLAQA
jgi:DNA-binding CsgD family transcriptional regulator